MANFDSLTWQRLNPYAITNGQHWVTRLLVNGQPGYLLWFRGRLIHRCFTTSTQAREYAADLELHESAAL